MISVYCLACEQCQDRVKVSLRLSRAAPPGQSAKLGCVTRTAAGRLPRCRVARKMPAQHTLSANIPFMQAALHAWQAASQTSAQWQMLRQGTALKHASLVTVCNAGMKQVHMMPCGTVSAWAARPACGLALVRSTLVCKPYSFTWQLGDAIQCSCHTCQPTGLSEEQAHDTR